MEGQRLPRVTLPLDAPKGGASEDWSRFLMITFVALDLLLPFAVGYRQLGLKEAWLRWMGGAERASYPGILFARGKEGTQDSAAPRMAAPAEQNGPPVELDTRNERLNDAVRANYEFQWGIEHPIGRESGLALVAAARRPEAGSSTAAQSPAATGSQPPRDASDAQTSLAGSLHPSPARTRGDPPPASPPASPKEGQPKNDSSAGATQGKAADMPPSSTSESSKTPGPSDADDKCDVYPVQGIQLSTGDDGCQVTLADGYKENFSLRSVLCGVKIGDHVLRCRGNIYQVMGGGPPESEEDGSESGGVSPSESGPQVNAVAAPSSTRKFKNSFKLF